MYRLRGNRRRFRTSSTVNAAADPGARRSDPATRSGSDPGNDYTNTKSCGAACPYANESDCTSGDCTNANSNCDAVAR